MKKKGIIIAIIAVMFSLIITLAGCGEKKEETNKTENTTKITTNQTAPKDEKEEKEDNKAVEEKNAKIKLGTYDYNPIAEDDMSDSYIELREDNVIILVDSFAGLALEGEYEVKGNKIVGKYTSMQYIDHTAGGEYMTKETDEEIELKIIDETTIQDLNGYGEALDNIMGAEATYTLHEEN